MGEAESFVSYAGDHTPPAVNTDAQGTKNVGKVNAGSQYYEKV